MEGLQVLHILGSNSFPSELLVFGSRHPNCVEQHFAVVWVCVSPITSGAECPFVLAFL